MSQRAADIADTWTARALGALAAVQRDIQATRDRLRDPEEDLLVRQLEEALGAPTEGQKVAIEREKQEVRELERQAAKVYTRPSAAAYTRRMLNWIHRKAWGR